LRKADTAWEWIFNTLDTGFVDVVAMHLGHHSAMHFTAQALIHMEPVSHRHGEGDNKLPVSHDRKHMIDQVSCGFCLSFGAARWAEASSLTRKPHDPFFLTLLAFKTDETMSQNSTAQIGFEFLDNIRGKHPSLCLSLGNESA
jgi:hypothetical protein